MPSAYALRTNGQALLRDQHAANAEDAPLRQIAPGDLTLGPGFQDLQARLKESEQARKIAGDPESLVPGSDLPRICSSGGVSSIGGVLVAKQGLSRSCAAQSQMAFPPVALQPAVRVQDFSTPMPRFDVLAQPESFHVPHPADSAANLTPAAPQPRWKRAARHTGLSKAAPAGRSGASGFTTNPPKIAVTATQEERKTNTVYNPQSRRNSIRASIRRRPYR